MNMYNNKCLDKIKVASKDFYKQKQLTDYL